MKINILGTAYSITEVERGKDKILDACDGYCDKTSKKIVVIKEPEDSELSVWSVYRNKIIRHEIIHAFLFESGLHENFQHKEFGHDETFVDWFAAQYPKIKKAFIAAVVDE